MRIHGTTRRRPLSVFQDEERHTLLLWDGEPYDIGEWRTAKVHPDHHIQCRQALYSVPSGLCPPGQEVEVRMGSKLVRIYHRGRLIKVHQLQPKGGRATDPDDYPAELSAYTTRAPDHIKREAAKLGPAVDEFAQSLFEGSVPWAKIRQGHKLLRLGERYSAQRLTPPAARPSPWTSSTCAAWSASWCRPWRRRHCPNCPCLCRRAALPVLAAFSPTPKEVSHDPNHRTYTPAQASPAGTHGRHPARAHRLARREQLDYASFLEIILSDEINRPGSPAH